MVAPAPEVPRETPLAIMVAPNGARRTKADHPRLPIGPAELAETAERALAAGAAMMHLHVRDGEDKHVLDAGLYREALAEIRRRVGQDMILQVTTEAVGRYQPDAQRRLLKELEPEAASLAVRELFPDEEEAVRSGEMVRWSAEAGISLQYILYGADDIARLRALQEAALVPKDPAPFLLFVLGRYTIGQVSMPEDLLPFLSAGGGADPWSLCAFGPKETACAAAALTLGGHVRVGFENNLWRPDGSPAEDTVEPVTRIAQLAHSLGRSLADAATARALFPAK